MLRMVYGYVMVMIVRLTAQLVFTALNLASLAVVSSLISVAILSLLLVPSLEGGTKPGYSLIFSFYSSSCSIRHINSN